MASYAIYVYDKDNLSAGTQKGLITTQIREGSFHYHSVNGNQGKFRYGNVCSRYCEFDYFTGNGAVAVNVGDVFEVDIGTRDDPYFNYDFFTAEDVNDDGNIIVSNTTVETDGDGNIWFPSYSATDASDLNSDGNVKINYSPVKRLDLPGEFYVQSVKSTGGVCHVVGYDAVSFLDKDYSPRLAQIKSSFPMRINDLLADVLNYCGCYTVTLYQFLDARVNYFYSEGITGRQIVSAIADMAGLDISAIKAYDSVTQTYNFSYIVFSRNAGADRKSNVFWNSSKTYVICPGDGTYYQEDGVTPATNVWYKEKSLDLGDMQTGYDGVEYVTSNGKSLGYYYDVVSPQNIYYITNNLMLDNIVESTISVPINTYAQSLFEGVQGEGWEALNSVFPYPITSVDIYPFRCPYNSNMATRLVDTAGTYYNLPIMGLDFTDERVQINAYGDGDDYGTDFVYGRTSTSAAYPVWITYQLHDGTYGRLTMAVNRKSGIAVVRWFGNSTTPPSGTKITVDISPYKSFLFALTSVMKNGNYLAVEDQNGLSDGTKVTAVLTASAYSNGELVIPLDQS